MTEKPQKRKQKPTDGRKTDQHGRKIPAIAHRDTAMRRFAENVDMEAFESFCDERTDDKFIALAAMLRDPAWARISFATLARRCQISLQELQEVYTNGMRHLGLLAMSTALPQVMSDVAADAQNTFQTCTRCDGNQVIAFGENGFKPCPQCEGVGKVKRMGDKHARDLVFETAKLTKQGGPLVAIQQNFGGGDTRLESMLKRTRSIVLDKPVPSEVGSTSEAASGGQSK